jgi:hypothetical protein
MLLRTSSDGCSKRWVPSYTAMRRELPRRHRQPPPESWRSTYRTTRDILQRFRESGLFANAKKCEFHQDTLQFLGVEVSQKGFEMEKMKVDMIEEWKSPKNVRGVHEFVGFCNFYRRFIKSFSEIAQPLHNLTKANQQWQWTEREQAAFDECGKMTKGE